MKNIINPATGKVHFTIPYTDGNLERLNDLQIRISDKELGFSVDEERMAATTPFAMVNMKNRIEKMGWENRGEQLNELSDNLSDAAKDYADDLTFWFTELVQNAMDSGWNKDDRTTVIELKIFKDKLVFFHNGRPPHYRNEKLFQHDEDGSELMAMIWKRSTKRASIGTEGRFGIGFKFWTYHFKYAKLDAEGWSCEWNSKWENIKLTNSDVDSGMQLTFREFKTETTEKKLEEFSKNPTGLLDDLSRLISGISMLPRSLDFSVSVNDKKIWQIKHEVEKLDSNFLKITNECYVFTVKSNRIYFSLSKN